MKLTGGATSFIVLLDGGMKMEEARKEVCDRLKCFCEELRDVALSCVQLDESRVEILRRIKKQPENEILCNHLLIDAVVDDKNWVTCSTIEVLLQSFANSQQALEMVRKIQKQVRGI